MEIKGANGNIVWTVHLANKKGVWELAPAGGGQRNPGLDRKSLVIDPGARSLVNKLFLSDTFSTGTFLGTPVYLGEMRIDADGHLLVLGGHGNADGPSPGIDMNSPGWFDDISDGPVTATVKIGVDVFEAEPSWVICAPPAFAPGIQSITTLYDILFQTAFNQHLVSVPKTPSFTRDIYPILKRAMDAYWVYGPLNWNYNNNSVIMNKHLLHFMATVIPPPGTPASRLAIFNRLRLPATGSQMEGNMIQDMPDLADSGGESSALTQVQYDMMTAWTGADGVAWINDWVGPPKFFADVTPSKLDRAALDACVGAALWPGIEASRNLRDNIKFSEPFRIDPKSISPAPWWNPKNPGRRLEAGDITGQMSLPWQADFYYCASNWWPTKHPDRVFSKGAMTTVDWARGIANPDDMAAQWQQLGFVLEDGGNYVEVGRDCSPQPQPPSLKPFEGKVSYEKGPGVEAPPTNSPRWTDPARYLNGSPPVSAETTARPFIRPDERAPSFAGPAGIGGQPATTNVVVANATPAISSTPHDASAPIPSATARKPTP